MAFDRRPKIGALFLAGDSWWEAGVCDAAEGPYAGFIEQVEADVAACTAVLAEEAEVITSGLLHTTEQVLAEAERFRAECVDGILFCPIIWTNDQPVAAFLEHAQQVPLLVWAYDPYDGFLDYYSLPAWLRSSGPVSVQQAAPLFERFGWPFDMVFGNEHNEETRRRIRAFARAAMVRASLEGTRIVVLPGKCDVVMGSWIEPARLREQTGVELDFVPVEDYVALVEGVSSRDAEEYANWLKERCKIIGVTDDALHVAAKQGLAFVRLAEEHGASGIALEDFNEAFYRLLGMRPHLTHPRLGEMGCTVGLEADVPGILATIIAGRLAGHAGMFNEFYTIDPKRGHVLMGHPGMGEPSLGDPKTFELTPDLEIDESQPRGVWWSYRARAGRMSFLNLTPHNDVLRATAFTGEALPGPRVMEGYAHMVVQPDTNAAALFEGTVRRACLQHWGTVHGDIGPELERLFPMLGINMCVLG